MNLGGKQNFSNETNQPIEVGGFKIIFRTMPQDMAALGLSMETISQPKEAGLLAETPSTSAKELYHEAKSLYRRKFYQAAIEKLEELISLRKGGISARWLLYRVRKKLKKYRPQELQTETTRPRPTPSLPLPLTIQKPSGAPFMTTQEEMGAKEKLLEQIQQEEREKTQLQEKLLEEQKERELMEKKLAEAVEKQKQEVARIEGEREKARLQEKLLEEQKERELMQRKLAEETEKQRELERQAREISLAPAIPPPANQLASAPQPLLSTAEPHAPKQEEGVVSLPKKWRFPSFSAKTLELAGVVIIMLAIFSGLVYWIGWSKLHPSAPSAEQTAVQSEKVLPASLFPVDETLSLSLQIGRKKTLFQELEKISGRNQAPGTFARILITFVSEDGTQNYASLGDLIDALQIAFPSEILNSLDKNNYTLFLYAQKNLPSSPFAISLGKNKIGLIVAITKKDNMAQKFLSWEKTMPQDLDALFLGKKISFPTQYQFEDIPYREVLIRAFDMPDQFSSLTYTFSDNKIIITTSLETTESLIDKLMPKR